jgi:molybdate transport system regulatory protein
MNSNTSGKKTAKRIIPRYRVYQGNDIALGPGKADLLMHIAATGSISEAARLMEMSYNRAWLLVRTMNSTFREPLVTSVRGGAAGGAAALTRAGEKAMQLYRRLEREAETATDQTRKELLKLLPE